MIKFQSIFPRINISKKTYFYLTVIACFFIAAIIVTVAAVRLTGSGLGCPTWPKCSSGSFTPTKAESSHSLIEFGNRLFTGAVSASVILAILGSLILKPFNKRLTWLSVGLVIGILIQIVLGGITVLVKLHPLAVGSHMLVSMAILSNAVILCYCAKSRVDLSLKNLFKPTFNLLLFIVTNLVVVAGIVVTAAGPHAGGQDTVRLDANIETVARIHSFFAWCFTILMLFLYFKFKNHSWQLKSLFLITLLQIAWGYSQYFNGIPAWMVIFHVFLAAMLYLFATLNWLNSTK